MTSPLKWLAQPTNDGDGVKIQRTSLVHQPLADPWLLLDELASDNPDDYIGGFPPHPHRGIQTISIMLKGGFQHKDHLGNEGAITAGGVQWMTAGRGIEHSEMPVNSEQGLHGFQLWLNLPAADKMSAPDWRDIHANDIPVLQQDFGTLRLIAGQWEFAVDGQVPLQQLPGNAGLAHLELKAGQSFAYKANSDENLMFYTFAGSSSDQLQLQPQQMLFFGEGGELAITAGEQGLSGLLLKGKPHKEPIANWGPFVMNTPDEIEAAIRQYRDGTFFDAR